MDHLFRVLLQDIQYMLASWGVGILPGLVIGPVADSSYLIHKTTKIRIWLFINEPGQSYPDLG